MKLYIVRHGETDWNKKDLMQGSTDIPLNLNGIVQAMELKKSLPNNFDICFVSPLKRAKKTADIITKCPKVIDERLIERNMGLLEGKKFKNFDFQKYWDWELNSNDNKVEKVQDLFMRVSSFINMLKRDYKEKTVLIVSHGATIRAINFCIKGFKKNEMFLKFEVKNCAVYEYEI